VPERAAEAMFEVRRIVSACRRRDADALGLMVRYKVHQTTVELLERMPLLNADVARASSAPEPAKPRAKGRTVKGRHGARAVSR
jgi:hypothetical protein